MDRRSFLVKSASFLVGSLFGLNGFSKAFGEYENSTYIRPRIALIIDDIGYSISRARQFLELETPITYSILPRLSHSLALEIHGQGHEIMLHQPMEPYNSRLDPGPGALYVGDGAGTIARIMEENVSHVPFAAGVNNHMGSRFTSSEREINETLRVVEKSGLFFVDSLTSSHSIAYKTARRFHMATACRNIFLDNVPNESVILSQLCKLKMHALKYGRAIGIGHPFPETARAIGQFSRALKDSNISLVHVTGVL
ncbi:MAG: divergent polysaccharide deacetylase family protein, partial [Deltaproteobacteria bacterium]|nr:divergent polysaccharide deacetylase family protein [Deltaproteobacteria bacterium]